MAILNRIQTFLDEQNITCSSFALNTGLNESLVYRLYSDPSYIPNAQILDRICSAYKIQPDLVLDWMPDLFVVKKQKKQANLNPRKDKGKVINFPTNTNKTIL